MISRTVYIAKVRATVRLAADRQEAAASMTAWNGEGWPDGLLACSSSESPAEGGPADKAVVWLVCPADLDSLAHEAVHCAFALYPKLVEGLGGEDQARQVWHVDGGRDVHEEGIAGLAGAITSKLAAALRRAGAELRDR